MLVLDLISPAPMLLLYLIPLSRTLAEAAAEPLRSQDGLPMLTYYRYGIHRASQRELATSTIDLPPPHALSLSLRCAHPELLIADRFYFTIALRPPLSYLSASYL